MQRNFPKITPYRINVTAPQKDAYTTTFHFTNKKIIMCCKVDVRKVTSEKIKKIKINK